MREDSQLLDGRWRRAAGAGWLRQRPLLVGSVATGALAVLLIAFVDRPLALWLKASLPPAVVAIAEAVSQLGVATGYVVVTVLLLAAFWLGARQVRVPEVAARLRVQARRCLFVLVSLAASGALINALKFALGRTRPRLLFDDGVYGLQPFNTDFATNSLPSGHAQTIWAVATALMLCFPRLRAPLVALAVLVSLARVVQTVHYPSDVLVGAVLAVVVTVLAKRHLFDGRGAPVGPEAVRRTGVDG